ncbi:MAG: xanthine dehydrogenase family protein molybdopterin-binding subunit [Chloroflexota bacterium]
MTARLSPDAGTLAALARPELRIDGPAKVTGGAAYAADHVSPGTLHARFLGSPLPHARIVSVSVERARAMPGVHAVLTGSDVVDMRFGRRLQDRPVLAWDRVRFVGDRIAAVAADSVEAADSAVAAIELELEELPAVSDPEAALASDAPVLHPDAAEYAYLEGTRPPVPHPNVQGRLFIKRGAEDLEAVFAAAAHVVEATYRTPTQHSAYLEPHATVAWIDEAGVAHIVTTNKAPFTLRKQMAAALGIPADQIVIDAGVIGGDFGGKGYSIDEYACLLLARASGRPVRAVARYAEELGQVNVRHAAVMHLRTAVDAEGHLLAHDARILLDGGAYASAKPLPHLALAGSVATMAGYRVPNVRIEALTVYTNFVPGGHVRSPGEVQALFAGESQLDELAREIDAEPLAFRLQNSVRQGDEGAAGEHYREARAEAVLKAAGAAIDWARPRLPGTGRGIAMSARHVGAGKLPLRALLHADGRVEVRTGLPDQGSGSWQVIRRALAVAASIDEGRVDVVSVPTNEASFDPGVGGSRVTHIASQAGAALGTRVREWLEERLPAAVPAAAGDVHLIGDRFVDGAGNDVASIAAVTAKLIVADDPVELETVYDGAAAHAEGDPGDYDFAACAVEVEVDPDTGRVTVRDAVIAADVGTIINPVAHRGQLEGGFVFGLGGALMEELSVDGGAVTSLSLADFKIPSAGDVPRLRIVLVPTHVGPGAFGAKMAGELTNAPVAPAIANAIADAVGVRIRELPLSAERVHRALDEGADRMPLYTRARGLR